MQDLEKLLRLENYKIMKIEERSENKKMIKVIYVESKNNKDKCPVCKEYKSSIHDKLKPIEVKYLKVIKQDTKVNIIKKRFICHKCNKKCTEQIDLNQKGKTISNKLEQKVLNDLLNYNFSIKYIAKINNISSYTVRNILLTVMGEYPEHIRNLPKVISFDEFKEDTNEGKYAFIINEIHRKALDISPFEKRVPNKIFYAL